MHYNVAMQHNVISFSDAIEFKVRSSRLRDKNTEQKRKLTHSSNFHLRFTFHPLHVFTVIQFSVDKHACQNNQPKHIDNINFTKLLTNQALYGIVKMPFYFLFTFRFLDNPYRNIHWQIHENLAWNCEMWSDSIW